MQMKTSMKASGMKAKEMGMEFSQKETEITLKVIGLMIREKDKDHTTSARRISCSLENGLMISLNVECIRKLKMKMLLQRKRNLISLISTHYLICLKFSQQIQQVFLKMQWKTLRQIEQNTELSTFQLMRCLLSKSFKILKRHFKLFLKVKMLSTYYH